MLSMRRAVSRQLRPCRHVLAFTCPFSVSAGRPIRQRPHRPSSSRPVQRPVEEDRSLDNRDQATFLSDNPPAAQLRQQSPLSSRQAVSPTSTSQPHQLPEPPTPQDTSTSGPYKKVLLASKTIRYKPASASPGHLTALTTKPQNLQLSAAEKFFASPCKFLYSAEALRHHSMNNLTPEVVVLGASNVGKSTFLNALVGQTRAARVSQTPGRTALMNAYGVGPLPKMPRELVPKGMPPPRHSLILVDTPGYGFRSQASWGDAIIKYLHARRMLRGAVVLLSSEKKLLPEDKWMLRTLAEANTRTLVVLTKADKMKNRWVDRCGLLADAVQQEVDGLNTELGSRWKDKDSTASHIHITAAGMARPGRLKNGGGLGGVRAAILEMAGFTLQETVTKKPDTVTYTGPVVSFDDIQWKI
ncbi:GTP-binding domain, HSR1-related protein [Metarhizium rileyi]|uniref:GTP-binding domain, HSR1-related protein n=1 Tax=Metarhizium rileyi (strain RCEF 4871) TaxID=1649241 RepID=A0A162I2Q3_METRR|nr:GTP-binding domain, HSR1-related protein [Metarhizium rileyi RCEF 4871]